MTNIKEITADFKFFYSGSIIPYILIFTITFALKIFAQEREVKSFYADDTLKSIIHYTQNVRQGEAKFYYPNGKIKEEMNYDNGEVSGFVKVYNEKGILRETFNVESGKREGPASLFDSTGQYLKDINYENGMAVKEQKPLDITSSSPAPAVSTSGENGKTITSSKITELKKKSIDRTSPPSYHEKDISKDPAYFLTAEIMPVPVGGMKAIMSKLVYPKEASEKGIQGVVKIRAFVDEYGEVTSDEVVQGIGYGCNEAAKIAVYYTQFHPGIIHGKPVKTQVVIPIDFKLNKK